MKRKIFDCTTFFNSNHLFEIRFHTLKNVVDYFVVCEANTTHTGQRKGYNFNINKWIKFKDKIIYIKVSNIKKIELSQKNKFDLVKKQIEYIFHGIAIAKPDDLIILSICFEINILFFNDSSELDLFFDESDDEVSPDWFDPIPITIKTIIPTIIFFFLLQFLP